MSFGCQTRVFRAPFMCSCRLRIAALDDVVLSSDRQKCALLAVLSPTLLSVRCWNRKRQSGVS